MQVIQIDFPSTGNDTRRTSMLRPPLHGAFQAITNRDPLAHVRSVKEKTLIGNQQSGLRIDPQKPTYQVLIFAKSP